MQRRIFLNPGICAFFAAIKNGGLAYGQICSYDHQTVW